MKTRIHAGKGDLKHSSAKPNQPRSSETHTTLPRVPPTTTVRSRTGILPSNPILYHSRGRRRRNSSDQSWFQPSFKFQNQTLKKKRPETLSPTHSSVPCGLDADRTNAALSFHCAARFQRTFSCTKGHGALLAPQYPTARGRGRAKGESGWEGAPRDLGYCSAVSRKAGGL